MVGLITIGSALLLGDKTSEKLASSTALVRDYSHKVGIAEAKVALVEFADFQCPACGAFYPSLKQATKEYQDRFSFTYRHFPLPSHPNAKEAALTSEAASGQGKFWEMQALLYERQKEWSEVADPTPIFEKYSLELNLNLDEFRKSVGDEANLVRVNQDSQDGSNLGVNSTPTLFINSKKYTGGLSYTDLKKAIEKELSK